MFDITLIHPKLVHFPIAFLLAALVFDVWGMIKKDSFYYRVGWVNLVLAILFSVFAIISGLLAANNVPHNDLSHETMELHETLGYVIGGILLILFLWRLRLKGELPQKGRAVYVLLLLGVAVTVVISADLGGKMVYEYGVAVKAVPQTESGEHSHDGDGGHSHGTTESTEDHDHTGDAPNDQEAHEHDSGMEEHSPSSQEAPATNKNPESSKTVHTHDDGTVHEH